MNLCDAFDIYIPTYGRAKTMITDKVLPNGIIVCPESQVDEYKKYHSDMRFMPCPDEVEGNMARKRNWIKDNAKKDWYMMIDDDLSYMQYMENCEARKMSYDHIMEVFYNCFVMCEDLGTVLWGVNLNTDPVCYRIVQPLSMLCCVLGPLNGHIKNNLRYDERMPTKEDYDYSLQVMYKYHKVLRFNKYSYMVGHINNMSGGSIGIRKMKMEEEQNILLQKKWGKKIVKFDMSKDIDPVIKKPLKGC